MNTLHRMAALAAATSLLASNVAVGQVSEESMGKVVPVELYVCNFNDGKGQDDLNAVIAEWTGFMDDRGIDSYAAWQLTPFYHGVDQDFDLIWMGASADGNAMGMGTHQYLTEGRDIAARFQEVMSCPVHVGLSSAMYQMPPQNETPGSAIMTMSDCSMNEGTRYSDVRSSEITWAAYRQENGSKAGMWHWYPTFGGGDQDFDYKIVYAFEDFKALGSDWEMIANGGGRQKSQSLFGDLDECDDERVYVARSIRAAQLRK